LSLISQFLKHVFAATLLLLLVRQHIAEFDASISADFAVAELFESGGGFRSKTGIFREKLDFPTLKNWIQNENWPSPQRAPLRQSRAATCIEAAETLGSPSRLRNVLSRCDMTCRGPFSVERT
jgi:hypothetical protein